MHWPTAHTHDIIDLNRCLCPSSLHSDLKQQLHMKSLTLTNAHVPPCFTPHRSSNSTCITPTLRSILPLHRGRGRASPHTHTHHTSPQHTTEQHTALPEQSPLGRSPSGRAFSSANHLLNFQHYSHSQHGRDRGFDGRGRGGFKKPAAKPMPYNRNKFLQANFRFLVSDAGNLKRHEVEADLMLDWDDVVQVTALTVLLMCLIV